MPTALHLPPAHRTDLLGFSDIVRIRNRVLEMTGKGARVLRLEGGEPFVATPDFIKQAMKDALDANETRYAPSSGIPQLLEAIRAKLAERNGLRVTSDEIIVTSGGAHGLFCAFQTTVNPGDEVLFFSPYWTPIRDQVRYCGGQPVLVPWDEVRDARDLTPFLQSRLTERTRVLYVNSPANPTGDVLTREQLASIAQFAIANNLVVIADEAYEDLTYEVVGRGSQVAEDAASPATGDPRPATSIASLPDMAARTISVYTLSKSFAMTGWRVGYVVAPEPFMGAIRKLVLNSINGVSTPSQFAAAAAIRDRSGHLATMRAEYRKRRDLLCGAFNAAGFRCLTPPGAFYLFPDVRERLGADSWKAMETLLARTSIASVPGAVFGAEGEGHLRMSYSLSMETIEAAVEALARL